MYTLIGLNKVCMYVCIESIRSKLNLGVCILVNITPNIQRPLTAKLCVPGEHVFEVQERHGTPLSLCQLSLVGLGYRAPPGGEKFDVFSFVCLFVCLSVTLLNVRYVAINALQYQNDLRTV